jgi:uncharacterized membrane protein YqjE
MQLISGIFLLIAVNKIRSFLIEQGMQKQVNYQAMYLHGISFSLYNLSIILLYTFYTLWLLDENPTRARNAFYVWIVTTYTNFIAQLCLIWIFLQFREKEEEAYDEMPTVEETNEERVTIVRLEKDDEEVRHKSEMKSRIEEERRTLVTA